MSINGGGGGRSREEAARWLEIAERLLRVRDLVGSKRFAERAIEADPMVGDAADQVIAAADVLLASQRRVNNQVNWYSVLQLDPSSPADRQPSAVLRQYRRLVLLLHPDRNHLEGAGFAAQLVSDAWAVLSDPSKKALFDAELDLATVAAAASAPLPDSAPTFWTACPSCYNLHQYGSDYEGKNLRCPKCRQAFSAAPLQVEPPIVPGTDMYYCSWGFVPLGFSGKVPTDALGPGAEWQPFYPMFRTSPFAKPQNSKQEEAVNAGASVAGGKTPVKVTPLASKKKCVAKKKVGSSFKKRLSMPESQTRSSERLKATSQSTTRSSERLKTVPQGTRSSERLKAKSGGIDMNAEV